MSRTEEQGILGLLLELMTDPFSSASEMLLRTSVGPTARGWTVLIALNVTVKRASQLQFFLFVLFFFSFIFISWRLITLQYCSGFCHTLT